MMTFSRILFALAVITGILAVVARFVQPKTLLMIQPATWVDVTGLLLLFSVAATLTAIHGLLEKKTV